MMPLTVSCCRNIKISGTNLVQQTDCSIADIIALLLFDSASGSRAAFAAYWLSRMGFCVKIALLTQTIFSSAQKNNDVQEKSDQNLLKNGYQRHANY